MNKLYEKYLKEDRIKKEDVFKEIKDASRLSKELSGYFKTHIKGNVLKELDQIGLLKLTLLAEKIKIIARSIGIG